MSEEEKKEFEEFLQWKAEKAKLAEQTGLDKQVEQPEMSKQTDSSVECEADAPQQKDSAQDTTKTSVDVPKENNSGLFIMVAAVSRRDRPLVSRKGTDTTGYGSSAEGVPFDVSGIDGEGDRQFDD